MWWGRAMVARKVASSIDIKAVIEEVLKKLGSGKASHRLLEMGLIYLTDTGGQQPFWDLIPIFAFDTSATVFVHRLCEELDEPPLNDLYQRGQQVGPSQRASLTTAQAFKTMLRGMHKGGRHSKIITVGTHRDLAGDCKETLTKKNERSLSKRHGLSQRGTEGGSIPSQHKGSRGGGQERGPEDQSQHRERSHTGQDPDLVVHSPNYPGTTGSQARQRCPQQRGVSPRFRLTWLLGRTAECCVEFLGPA